MTASSKSRPVPIKRYTLFLVGLWTLFLILMFIKDVSDIRTFTRTAAIHEIEAYFNKDRALRTWAANHGGLYVPVTSRTPPSPYLEHIPDRDVITPNGRKLTLMSPSQMMRQVSENFASLYGVVARTTSLYPLRLANTPDAWERVKLQGFEKGEKDRILEFVQKSGIPHLRLMEPVLTRKKCLNCHGHQGYDEGDIRGGISISLPMTKFFEREKARIYSCSFKLALIWMIGMLTLLFGGRSLHRRIRERDKAQAELAVSEQKFRTVADFTYNWESWLDDHGLPIYISPSCERITGYSAEAFYQDPDLLLSIMHPADRHIWATHLETDLDHESVCQLEFRIRTRSGHDRWIAHTCKPVFNDRGGFLGRRAGNRDITDRKSAEIKLERYAAGLEKSNRDLQSFAYMTSHDLREPVILIKAFSDRLRATCHEHISEQGSTYLQRIEKAADRMEELIDGILSYCRLSSRELPLMRVNLDAVLEEVLNDLEIRIRQTGGQVITKPLCTISADPLQMRQLFMNLIGNGLKYRRSDREPVVCIYLEGADRSATDSDSVCTIVVEDNGIGFDPASAEEIFGLFTRLHSRAEFPGTGIGLAVCKRIVERHGGTISAHSIPSEGTRFVITLPTSIASLSTSFPEKKTHSRNAGNGPL